MSPVIETATARPSLLDRLSIVSMIVTLTMAIVGGALGVWITQATTTTRLSSVEKQVEEDKAERVKQVDDLRNKMLTRGDLDALLRALADIREDVKDIRAELLRQARERR